MKVEPLSTVLGLEVTGLVLQECSSSEIAGILRLVGQAGLVVFRRQCLCDRDLYELAQRIGPLELSSRRVCLSPDYPAISYLSNFRDEQGTPIGFAGSATDYWHSDQQHRETPATLAFLYAVVPSCRGGATSFVSTDVVTAGLDEQTVAELANRRAVYEPAFTHDNVPKRRVTHPALLTCPVSRRRFAYVSENTLGFTGLNAAMAAALRDRVLGRCTQPGRIYSHKWITGDFLLYDNAQLLHRREGFEGRRWLKGAKIFAPGHAFAVPTGRILTARAFDDLAQQN